MTWANRKTNDGGVMNGSLLWTSTRRRIAAVLSTLLMAMGIAVASSVPASAEPNDCPHYYACTWIDYGANGGMTKFEYSIADFGAWTGYDNSASTAYNFGASCNAVYYQYRNYTSNSGRKLSLNVGRYISDLRYQFFGSDGATWDNRISSGRFESC